MMSSSELSPRAAARRDLVAEYSFVAPWYEVPAARALLEAHQRVGGLADALRALHAAPTGPQAELTGDVPAGSFLMVGEFTGPKRNRCALAAISGDPKAGVRDLVLCIVELDNGRTKVLPWDRDSLEWLRGAMREYAAQSGAHNPAVSAFGLADHPGATIVLAPHSTQ